MPSSSNESIAETVASEQNNQASFLVLNFDSILSSSARNLQNLTVSKNVWNSWVAYQCDWFIVF